MLDCCRVLNRENKALQVWRWLANLGAIGLIACVPSSCESGRTATTLRSWDAGATRMMPLPVVAAHETLVRPVIVGTIKHPLGSTSDGLAAFYQRGREYAPLPLRRPIQVPKNGPPGSDSFEELLDGLGLSGPVTGEIEFEIDGERFFETIRESIAAAQYSIDWHLFIFTNDDLSVELADLLAERADDLKVRLLLDRLGSMAVNLLTPERPLSSGSRRPASIQSYLERESRVRVRKQSNPWFLADHRKVFLFDREIAFLGGMNVADHYAGDHRDLMVKLTGPVVGALADGFERDWRRAGLFGDLRGIPAAFRRSKTPADGEGIAIRILDTSPWIQEIERAQIAAIRASQRRIVLITPYFSSLVFTRELEEALQRGVDITLVLPNRSDVALVDGMSWELGARLHRAGARVFVHENPNGILHMKAAVYDDWVCLGSANMDTLSLRVNRERNIAFRDPATVDRFLREVVEPVLGEARELDSEEVEEMRWRLFRRTVRIIGRQL